MLFENCNTATLQRCNSESRPTEKMGKSLTFIREQQRHCRIFATSKRGGKFTPTRGGKNSHVH